MCAFALFFCFSKSWALLLWASPVVQVRSALFCRFVIFAFTAQPLVLAGVHCFAFVGKENGWGFFQNCVFFWTLILFFVLCSVLLLHCRGRALPHACPALGRKPRRADSCGQFFSFDKMQGSRTLTRVPGCPCSPPTAPYLFAPHLGPPLLRPSHSSDPPPPK